jgi:adenylate cyclase
MAGKNQSKILIKRVANLVKQNQELESNLKEFTEKYEKLLHKHEKYEKIVQDISPDAIKGAISGQEKSRNLKFDMVTILYTNIYGFSKVSKHKKSSELMDELDEFLFQSNTIIKSYNTEKIKTIGDAYMVAGGIPKKNMTNPVEVVLSALKIQELLNKHHEDREEDSIWDLTFAIHTGPVTASTSGKKKINYDIKGDTVNIVTRMESSTESRKVIISVMTYELIKEFFSCEYYGEIPVKYKGDLKMYEVKGLKDELTKRKNKIEPNEKFNTKFLLMQFTDIQEYILNKLEKELPSHLYYHNVKHTVDVVTQAELIGLGEGVSDEDILLLKTAALFHDAGHTIGYDNHEENGAIMAQKVLPDFKYTDKQIETICNIIKATQLPPTPKTLLEKIMCDADLDYLGRSDFIPVSNTLYEELREQNKIGSFNDWNKLQIKFLSGHQFFTETAKNLREVNKQKQIERIKEMITDE